MCGSLRVTVSLRSKEQQKGLAISRSVKSGKWQFKILKPSASILERLGLEVIFRYEKYRTAYSFKSQRQQYSVNLAVDETPIGNYLEIEGRQADIIRVAAQLGLGGKDAFITESYLALFAKSRLRRSQEHMVFQVR